MIQFTPELLAAYYGLLDEQQRRLFAGLESIRLGHGGDTLLGDFLGLDVHTVAHGRQQLLDRNVVSGPTRRQGGGRKSTEKNARHNRFPFVAQNACVLLALGLALLATREKAHVFRVLHSNEEVNSSCLNGDLRSTAF